jgi:hypothetical protein
MKIRIALTVKQQDYTSGYVSATTDVLSERELL